MRTTVLIYYNSMLQSMTIFVSTNKYRILSTVLKWDIRDFEGRAKKVKASPASPSPAQLKCLDAYAEKSPADQESIRTLSSK